MNFIVSIIVIIILNKQNINNVQNINNMIVVYSPWQYRLETKEESSVDFIFGVVFLGVFLVDTGNVPWLFSIGVDGEVGKISPKADFSCNELKILSIAASLQIT